MDMDIFLVGTTHVLNWYSSLSPSKKRPHDFATLPLSSFSLFKNCLHIVLRFNLYLKWEHFLIIYRLFLSVMGKTIIRLSFLFWPFLIE